MRQDSRRRAVALLFALLATASAAGAEPSSADEQPVSLGTIGSQGEASLFGAGAGRELVINGFGVATYGYDLNTDRNSFGGSALAVSLYKSITDRLDIFGQLTGSREADSPFVGADEEDSFSTEIDNLQVRWVASPAAGLDVTFGKFDSPLAVERDDAPLNFQATESFTFQFARPVKFTGLQVHEAFGPRFEAWGIVANGWDVSQDNNKAKTVAVYGLWSPSMSAHAGLGVIHGAEKDGRTNDPRTTAVATLLFQPAESWVWGGEIVSGREPGSAPDGSAARWFADMLFAHLRFGPHWGLTLRADYLDDIDGARTGTRQVLQSITVSPQYRVGGGFYGVFRYLDRTSLRLPEFVVRLDLRKDRSTEPVFLSKTPETGRRDNYSATFQTVFLF
jgi:hypothetical protein